MVWHPLYTFTNDGAAPPAVPSDDSGGARGRSAPSRKRRPVWTPLLDFDRDKKRDVLQALHLIEEESGVKRERAKARKLERDVKAAQDAADIKALSARIAWAVERATELRREEDDEEDAIVLLALLH